MLLQELYLKYCARYKIYKFITKIELSILKFIAPKKIIFKFHLILLKGEFNFNKGIKKTNFLSIDLPTVESL